MFLRNELCSNNLYDFGLKKGLDHLDEVRQRFKTIISRFAGFQAQWLNVHTDFPPLQRMALPVPVGSVRHPGIKIHDTRIIRLLEVLLHAGTHVGGWTAREIHQAVLSTFHLSADAYGLNQLRYDLRKLKGHGLLERDGTRYAHLLTPKGVQVALLFLFFHKRLCGPLANSRFHHRPDPQHRPDSRLEAAYHRADKAIEKVVTTRIFRNPAELTKQVREKLPRRPKRVVRHHPALPYAEASQFMTDLSAAGGTAASMLRFLILTACRTNEVVEARWSEIDRASSTWKIPGERMKMHQDHVVPLSDPALAILDKMHNGTQGELIFPNPDDGMFSENAMLAVLDRLGYSHVTVHGFRSTFATWAEECTEYPDGVREAALAHKYKSETTAAYQRGQKLEKRRILMKDWAQFLAGSNVIRLDKAG